MAQGGMIAPGNVSPVVSAFCFLLHKSQVPCFVDSGSGPVAFQVSTSGGFVDSASNRVVAVKAVGPSGPTAKVHLRRLCCARSGDKGDAANIGLIARRPEYLPFLRHAVTCDRVRAFFQPDCHGQVERFDLPGLNAMNFLLHNTLGGAGGVGLPGPFPSLRSWRRGGRCKSESKLTRCAGRRCRVGCSSGGSSFLQQTHRWWNRAFEDSV